MCWALPTANGCRLLHGPCPPLQSLGIFSSPFVPEEPVNNHDDDILDAKTLILGWSSDDDDENPDPDPCSPVKVLEPSAGS